MTKDKLEHTGSSSESGDLMTPEEAIKDPLVLEFLDLKDEYSESDLEEALIKHLTDSTSARESTLSFT